ncbi:hypothetical protein OUZ56_027717 [Daphnia magna]|uniref:Uncharacterized protein n=1 Tax=Daphnia magna TaxID=35525 RepID=A0ABR0B1P9_9CRUS|nr:hypothetical protein OUZ56_027717 [Daphnia magna]
MSYQVDNIHSSFITDACLLGEKEEPVVRQDRNILSTRLCCRRPFVRKGMVNGAEIIQMTHKTSHFAVLALMNVIIVSSLLKAAILSRHLAEEFLTTDRRDAADCVVIWHSSNGSSATIVD